MAKTISTHNGSTVSREHNIRNPKVTDKQDHIDKELIHQNEILHDEKPREAYERIFGEALRKYNAKQTREDREIKNYYAHVEKDAKKHAVYEMIVQIGDRNDTGIDAPVERECLREFYEGWKKRNPNLECIGAYIHADESDGTIHMHLDYVPVATGYKRGLETQNGLVKALEQQGFVKDKEHPLNAQIQWEARENAVLEEICNAHGIEVIHPKEEGRKHLHTETFKAEKRLEEMKFEADVYEDIVDKSLEIKIAYEQDAENAIFEREKVRDEVSDLRAEKTSLEGQIEAMREEKKALEQEIPTLKAWVLDARDELKAIESAIKEKMEQGMSKFGPAFKYAMDKAREVMRMEKFVKHPNVKQAYESFKKQEEQVQQQRKNKSDRER